METLYIKKGKRYIPAGCNTSIDLYPGVWIVQKTPGCTSMQSICLSELPSVSSLIEAVQARLLAQIIIKKIQSLVDVNQLLICNRSIGQLESDIFDSIVEHVNKGREEAANGSHDMAKYRGIKMAEETVAEIISPSTKYTWHNESLSKIYLLLDEIQEVGNRKCGTHEFVWYVSELKRLLKNTGYDLNNCSVGGMIVNPEENE